MRGVIKLITVEGPIIVHEIEPGRTALEVVGIDWIAALHAMGIGLKEGVKEWPIGEGILSVRGLTTMEQLINRVPGKDNGSTPD